MKTTATKLITFIAATALLAGCGGGGAGGGNTSLPSTPTQSSPQQPGSSKVVTGLAVKVDVGAKKSSSKVSKTAAGSKRPAQLTTDITDLAVTVDGTTTDFSLNPLSNYCGQAGQTFTCAIAASVGSHTVSVATKNGSAIVGYAIPANNVSVAALSVTTVNFTLTPVATSFSGSWSTTLNTPSLPEDGDNYLVSVVADVLAIDGELISSPIDNANLFGTVTVSTSPATFAVTAPSQTIDPAVGSYTDSNYTFLYDGSEVSGDQLSINEAYTKNTSNPSDTETAYNGAVTASGTATAIATIPLTRLEIPNMPNPSGATLNGATFDPSNSWYYIPPSTTMPEPNRTNDAALVFNNVNPSQTAFVLHARATNNTSTATVSGSCDTASGSSGPIYTIASATGSPNGVTYITINPPDTTGQSTASSCTLTVTNGTFSNLQQTITVYPSTSSLNVTINSVHRHN